ncbi:MAG: S1 RNA-binding domain-containing protein [Candidatus Aminicenantes bacterium]|nr:S1 RNA-binding domain-containing protein [Candidatus Aminicenantes bacterium]
MTEKKTESITSENNAEASFADMLNASVQTSVRIKIGAVAEGKVISIGKDNIFMDLGTRAEGMIDREEFIHKGHLTIQEGETVQVMVRGFRDGIFHCTSRLHDACRSGPRQSKDSPALQTLREAFSNRLPVEGRVKSLNKGGFEVYILGQKAFCPISQIEKNYCQNPESHLDKIYPFLVNQYEEDGRNVVVGRKELLLAEEEEKSRQLWQEIHVGQVCAGTVTSVHDYGAFVDIGGIEGLLHVSEISFKKTLSVQETLRPGQKLNVAIIKLDREANKVSLSLKALQMDPWVEAVEKIQVGKEYDGVVLRLKPFGAFIELLPGLVGLLHISQLGVERRVSHPKEILSVGQEVHVRILSLDLEKKTISLTMEEAEIDYSAELSRLKEKQEKELKNGGMTMAAQLDSAIKKTEN